MALFNFGVQQGLAYKHDFNSDMANRMRRLQFERQAKIEAENKTRLVSDLFQFGKVADPWNTKRLKEFSESQVKEIGKIISQNPEFTTNPETWGTLKMLSRGLVDNQITTEAASVQKHKELMDKWSSEKGNDPGDPDYIEMLNSYNRYIQTGSADGNPKNRHVFQFIPPEDRLDVDKYLEDRAHAIRKNGFEKIGYDGHRQFVTDEDVWGAVNGVINDAEGPNGRKIKQKYDKLIESGSLDKAVPYKTWVYSMLKNNVRDEDRNLGHLPPQSMYNNLDGRKNALDIYDSTFNDPLAMPTPDLQDFYFGNRYSGNSKEFNSGERGMKMRVVNPKTGQAEFVELKSTADQVFKIKAAPDLNGKEITVPGREVAFPVTAVFNIGANENPNIGMFKELQSLGYLQDNEWFDFQSADFDDIDDIVSKNAGIKVVKSTDADGKELKQLEIRMYAPADYNVLSRNQVNRKNLGAKVAEVVNQLPGEGEYQYFQKDGVTYAQDLQGNTYKVE